MADKEKITSKKLSANVTLRSDGCLIIQNVRLSYPHLFKAWSKNESEKKKFSGRFLLDKKEQGADIKAIAAHLKSLMQEHFKGAIPKNALFLRDGADTAKPEQEGCYYVQASEDTAPDVLNRDKSKIEESDDVVYAGCYVNVMIRPWAQNNIHGKRINANLLAVQFVKNGERFGAERPRGQDAFDEVEGEFEDDDVNFEDDDIPF